MKNLLFITWDGPQTSYMEGLFLPIFQEISKQTDVRFHVMQFTWADQEKTTAVKKVAEELGIRYTAVPVLKKPVASLGSFITLFSSSGIIKNYCKDHHIDIVMPRSTFPAMMVNRIKNKNFKIIFDADGLPIEERVDFAGLQKNSRQYRWMKSIETQMLHQADAVITRSQKAIEVHLQNIGEAYRNKFSVVQNGRDPEQFHLNPNFRKEARKQLGISEQDLLFVYAGSLGPQYCWEEMIGIFSASLEQQPAKFLVLTGNTDYATSKIPEVLAEHIIIKKVPFAEIPFWLNAGDVAFALRQPSFSMQGVAPIKLGEYLLCGLPVIASKGIGDTEKILHHFSTCYLYDHDKTIEEHLPKITAFTENAIFADRMEIREIAKKFFSLEAAAKSYISVLEKIENGK